MTCNLTMSNLQIWKNNDEHWVTFKDKYLWTFYEKCEKGASGIGFKLTENGYHDIQNKKTG